MHQPVTPSMCPSTHQPSRMLRLGTPFSAAFIPLVPEASSGNCGVVPPISPPDASSSPTPRVKSWRNTLCTDLRKAFLSLKNLPNMNLPPLFLGCSLPAYT